MKKSGYQFIGAMFLLAVGLSTQAANNPNIVIILTDDVGWGDISTYNPSSLVELPAIDGLADEGIRFTDAHTSASKCAPSRYSIVTGNYQWRGLRTWGQWRYKGGSQLLSGQLSLGDVLQQANYSSAFIGKYHLGANFFRKNSNVFVNGNDAEDIVDFSRPMVDGPQDHGFNYSFTALRGIQDSPYAFFENGLLDGAASDLIIWETGDYGDTEIEKAGIGLPSWVTRDVGPTLLSKAIEFIDTHIATQVSQGTDNPFFLYFNTEAVHSPRKPPISLGGRSVLGASGVSDRTDMLIEIDVIVEQILLALEERNLINETIIIFTSDNGAQRLWDEVNAGHLSVGALRGDKGSIYEGGHRVPLIIKWGPAVFESSSLTPGTEITTLVGIQDVFATLADMVDVPLAADQGRDSFSFLPALMGQTTGTIRDHMVHEADEPEDGASDGIIGRHFAYRHNNWKLIFNNNQNPVGLYDLDSDLFESTNLINESQHASLVAQLHALFLDTRNSERTAPVSGNATPVVSVISPSSGSTFETGEVIAFSGSANDNEDGDLSSGLAWSSSLDGALGVGASINVSLSAGPHVITASVADSGSATGTETVTVTVNSPTSVQRDILFVSNSTASSSADLILVSLLQNSGHLITVIDDDVVATTDGIGRDLIVISSTVVSGKVGDKFQLADVPVMTWEAYLFDNMGMTGVTADVDFGVLSNQQSVDVASSGHPLTAGLSGNVQLGLTNGAWGWGVPSGDATIAATLSGDPSRATIFAYDLGDSMPGLIAPARRVGLALGNDTASNWTPEAQLLFNAAVDWVFSPAFNTAPIVEAGNAQTVFVNTPVSLTGQVIDDGVSLPLTTHWSLWSSDTGGNASFTDASNPVTTVSFDTVGSYTLQLEASDPDFTSNDKVVYTVVAPPANTAPVAEAGPARNVTTGVAISLAGSYVDDSVSLPIDVSWQPLTTPVGGTASIADSTSLTSSVSFDVPGDYELELTVSDPEFSSTDTVIFTVTDTPIMRDILLVVGAAPAVGADAVIVSNLEANGYAVTVIDDDVVATTDGIGRDLIVISSTVSSGKVGDKFQLADVPVMTWEAYLFDNMGMTGVTADVDFGVLSNQQSVDVASSGHPLTAGLSGNVQLGLTNGAWGWGVPSGDATIAATLSGDPSRATIFAYDLGDSMPGLIAPARRVGLALGNDTASNWTPEAQLLFNAAVDWVFSPAFNTAPIVEAGNAQTVFVNTPVSLTGQVIDDGVSLPLTTHWSLWSSDTGGNASFTDASNPVTTVSFDTVGSYTLQLEASDPDFTSNDKVVYTVVAPPANTAPVAEAGPARNVTTGVAISLAGSYVDDSVSLPIDVSWQPLTAPVGGTASIADSTSLTSSVSFDVPGDYELELTVSDPEFSSTDTVIFTVTDTPIMRDILLVVGAAPAVGADAVIVSNLEANGYAVTVIDDDVVATTDGIGRDLIVISSTVSSGKVGDKFQLADVPVMTWEAYLFDNMGMTGVTADVDFGVLSNQQSVDVASSGHPLTAGLSGNVQLGLTNGAWGWGVPSGDATIAATLSGDPSRATIFAYDLGDSMPGLIAPARRVGFVFGDNTASNWTPEGQLLFNAAVDWVFSPAFNTAPIVEAGEDFSAQAGVPVQLPGAVVDDGLALPLIVNWGALTGVSYSNETDPNTTATFDTPGIYQLELSASDPEYFQSDTVIVTVTDGTLPKSILFVSGSASATANDQILIARMAQHGHQIQIIDDDVLTSGSATNFDLVLVSSSVSSGKVGNKLTGAVVPVITWEAWLFDNLGLSGDQSGDYGSSDSQIQIEVTNGAHPLGAGLSGSTIVTSNPQRVYWGMPGANAINIAHVAGDPTRSTVFAYETGSLLANNRVAPARRIGLFMGDTAPAVLTAEGLQLFDSAVAWALDSPSLDIVRIMPLGDSITRGGDGYWSYRHTLSDLLNAQQCVFDFVGSQNGPSTGQGGSGLFDRDHEGHSGFRTDEIEASIAGWIADNQADWALIHLGTNDILQAQSVPVAVQNISDIIDILRAQNPNIGILLAQIIPNLLSNDLEVVQLNQEIATLVANKTQPGISPVLLVDQYSGYDSSTLNYDMIHPNVSGEDLMANTWMQAILPEIQAQGFCN